MTFLESSASPGSENGLGKPCKSPQEFRASADWAQSDLEPPPGKVGDIARFIYWFAPYPNSVVAICGALALVAAIFSRSFNVSGTGLNVWIAIVGSTGIGKEAAQSGIFKLVSTVAKTVPAIFDFVGASSWASPEAVHKRLAKTPCVLGFIGELGIKIKVWCSPKASLVHSALVAFFLDVFGKSGSGNMLGARENSDAEKGARAVEAPNLSLLGDTTEATLFEAADEAHIANGFWPRWIFAFAGNLRASLNRVRQLEPPADLIEWLKWAAGKFARDTEVTNVPLSLDAQAIDDEIEDFTRSKVNDSEVEISRHLWSRVRLSILKIAALIAVGDSDLRNGEHAVIKEAHILWAKQFVFAGVERILSKFENGEFGEEAGNQAKQQRLVLWAITDFFENYHLLEKFFPGPRGHEYASQHVIPYAHISQRIAGYAAFKNDRRFGAREALNRTIKELLDADFIREVPAQQMGAIFGGKGRGFVVADPYAIKQILNRN